ncbi:MAG: DUF2071 domain-containing protein [Acidobacteriota bacterium]
MHLRTEARDCLYVNWILPASAAPPLERPLRYELHSWRGEEWVFTTALFFRLSGLRSRSLPFVRLSYPQMSLRLYVFDEKDVPSVLFVRMWAPLWVVPVARLVGRQPARSGRFSYPRFSGSLPADEASWGLRAGGGLEVRCRPGAPAVGEGPEGLDWRRTVEAIRHRQRGYLLSGRGMRSLQRQQPSPEVVPMSAEVATAGLLEEVFVDAAPGTFDRPHSAWLCPRVPVVFELGKSLIRPLAARRQMAAVPDGC